MDLSHLYEISVREMLTQGVYLSRMCAQQTAQEHRIVSPSREEDYLFAFKGSPSRAKVGQVCLKPLIKD